MAGEREVGVAAIGLTFGLSLLHAALPNHWLPFVLVGRALHWTRRRTLSVLALAGGGHVLTTSALGLLVWWMGDTLLRHFTKEDVERMGALAAGSLLVGLGTVYLLLHMFGRHGHSHAQGALIYADVHAHAGHDHAGHDPAGHDHAGHDHAEHDHAGHDHAGHDHAGHQTGAAPAPPGVAKLKERGAIVTLFLALTFSPCEAVVAAFVPGVRLGFGYVLVLAIAASLATVAGMFALTWLTLAGVERLRFPWLDRNEMSLTGAILIAIGVLVLVLPG